MIEPGMNAASGIDALPTSTSLSKALIDAEAAVRRILASFGVDDPLLEIAKRLEGAAIADDDFISFAPGSAQRSHREETSSPP